MTRRSCDNCPCIFLRLSGRPQVLDTNGGAIRFPTCKAFVLFVYLARSGGAGAARDELVELFWPVRPDRDARRALRGTLHEMRSAFRHDAEKIVGHPRAIAVVFAGHAEQAVCSARYQPHRNGSAKRHHRPPTGDVSSPPRATAKRSQPAARPGKAGPETRRPGPRAAEKDQRCQRSFLEPCLARAGRYERVRPCGAASCCAAETPPEPPGAVPQTRWRGIERVQSRSRTSVSPSQACRCAVMWNASRSQVRCVSVTVSTDHSPRDILCTQTTWPSAERGSSGSTE